MDLQITFDTAVDVLRFGANVSGGDLAADDGLRSAVVYSLFTDRIADEDDAIPDGGNDKRGHWGDSYLPESEGSRLWLLKREKQTQTVLNRAKFYAEESLQWLIDDGHVTGVDVVASWLRLGVLALAITIISDQHARFSDTFHLG